MADYEGRYDGNGEDVDGSSPQPRSTNHGALDDYGDSKSQVSYLYLDFYLFLASYAIRRLIQSVGARSRVSVLILILGSMA